METIESTIKDGKLIEMTRENIWITPSQPSDNLYFTDKARIPVFPHPTHTDKVREVYKALTQ